MSFGNNLFLMVALSRGAKQSPVSLLVLDTNDYTCE